MAYRQPGLSRTLPKDFTFYAGDEENRPRTPDRPTKELTIPPPPHHSSCRFRRPRLTISTQRELFCSPDVPLPSIELSHDPSASVAGIFDGAVTQPMTENALQVPPRGRVDPRTPPAQIRGTPVDERPCWTYGDTGDCSHPIQRPSSACSDFSDSSAASSTSCMSYPSMGGSCTSPESEIQDPFISYPFTSCKQEPETPSKPNIVHGKPGKIPTTRPRWTSEMDNHLWNTYQIYLQDPRITPFKMVPGSLPPLGVSHRVAREARKSWSRKKGPVQRKGPSTVTSVSGPVIFMDGRGGNRKYQQATHDSATRSGSTTPTAKVAPPKPAWPRSDSFARRRLKDLCKRKFSIGPHYQRLLQSRSPSPFLETSPESATRIPLQLGVSHRKAASFATRDLGVSLVSSFLPTQVAELGPPTSDLNNGPQNDWFNNISRDHEQPARTPKHFHSHSSSSLGDYSSHITTSSLCDEIPRLGSPFMYHTWGPDSSRRRLRSATPASQFDTIHTTSLKTRSPGGRIDQFGNAHKRRALHQLEDELDSSGSSLQRPFPDLIRQPRYNDNMGQRRVRVRNRGITTGAIGGSRGRLDQLFNPPAHFAEFRGSSTSISTGTASTTSATTVTAPTTGASDDGQKMQQQDNNINNINNTSHHLRHGDDIKRLGSPFHSDPFDKYNNRKHLTPSHPPRHAPSLSDPFTATSFASMPSATARNLEQRHPVLMSNCQETPNSESAMTTPRAYFDEERGGKGGSGVGMSMSAGLANGDGLKLDTLDTPNTPFS
ncbi:conserved hypothetical protein [Histoplasma capsulatum G186AR]|uniref:Uncharacterized protein n=2 Tax=Ajellomyces capsulatus TaxID=5037 RepID=C0NSC6_AJECG|nr:uncharacterized protein HCBG_06056 [Histoplasma capsulatum G186AR]EEH05792.1 conserved hypothetical protein [Histoplasma capsulatum G186AR]KAG5300046.1 hypothetical protein I7I52_10566 [Histoplasma capsulatum]QSS67325.1 hypothetical protein I7I50_06361 [Histoplasma capsulatum G186AR]